jgi:hypothetical protein
VRPVACIAFSTFLLAAPVKAQQAAPPTAPQAPAPTLAPQPPAPTVAPQAPPPTAVPPAPTSTGSQPAPAPEAPPGRPPEVESAGAGQSRFPVQGFVFLPRLGFILTGSGEGEVDCSGTACGGASGADNDVDERSVFGLGGDVLYQMSPNLRLGLGLLLVPSTKFETEAENTESYGIDLSTSFVVEGIFPVSPTFALTVRGQVGPTLLFAGGDQSDAIAQLERQCSTAKANGATKCEVFDGPYLGYSFGLGGGVVFAASNRVRLRADLLYQRLSLPLLGYDVEQPMGTTDARAHLSSGRLWLLPGVEFLATAPSGRLSQTKRLCFTPAQRIVRSRAPYIPRRTLHRNHELCSRQGRSTNAGTSQGRGSPVRWSTRRPPRRLRNESAYGRVMASSMQYTVTRLPSIS